MVSLARIVGIGAGRYKSAHQKLTRLKQYSQHEIRESGNREGFQTLTARKRGQFRLAKGMSSAASEKIGCSVRGLSVWR